MDNKKRGSLIERIKSNEKAINTIKAIIFPFISIVAAMFIAVFFVMWAKGYSITQYFTALSELFEGVWKGSFQNQKKIFDMLIYVSPMIFTGVAHSLAFKTGLFNIGVSGQFVLGMLAAGIVGLIPGIPMIIHIPLIIIAGMIFGGIWAAIPGFLKAKFGINEVVNTIMMNYIGLYFVNWIAFRTIFCERGKSETFSILSSAQIPKIIGDSRASWAIALALIVAVLGYILLWKTRRGYELRAVGNNLYAAEYGGINIPKNMIMAMVISGAIAGLGGAMHVAGTNLNITSMVALPDYGFDGIAVALLAKSNPIGCIASAILFGALRASSRTLQINGIPKEIVALIQGIVIIFVAIDYIYKYLGEKKKKGAMING